MNTAYLILGGNIGNKLQNMQLAIQLIEDRIAPIAKKSDIFVTEAWGNHEQPDFINQATCIDTALSADELLNELLMIEEHLGRKRTDEKWGERTMDIDILFYNNEVIDTPRLKIPHPFIQERKFVLIPMMQIAKEFIHPILNKSIEQLLNESTDTLVVSKL